MLHRGIKPANINAVARTSSPSAFDIAVIRDLRERHNLDDVQSRTLEDWRACGAIDRPPTPRLRGFHPDYETPVGYVDRVVEMRGLVREEGHGRQLAALRLLVRHGEGVAPDRARELAAQKPELLRRATQLERPSSQLKLESGSPGL